MAGVSLSLCTSAKKQVKSLCAPENTLPLLLSVALLFITTCITCFIVSDVLISPACRWGHVVCLWSGGASVPCYGVYQHYKQEHRGQLTYIEYLSKEFDLHKPLEQHQCSLT